LTYAVKFTNLNIFVYNSMT